MPNPLVRNRPPQVREENGQYQSAPLVTLDCVIERVTYHNADTGHAVVKVMPADVKDKDKADRITVIGAFQSPQEGECLRVYGSWVKHPKWGSQLKAERYETLRPATAAAMEKYLGSGAIKGIGPKMAERIIKKFGDAAFDIIENHPDKLATVQGIGEKRVGMIQKTWIEQQEIRNVMVFLQKHGITPTYAVKIYKKYKDRSIEIVEQNPFQLASDIWGIGFKSADKIAQNLGFALDAPARLEAGLVFVLNDQMDSGGHCFLPREELLSKACQILLPEAAPEGDAIPDTDLTLRAQQIETSLDTLLAREALVAESVSLVGHEEIAIYTPSIFATEKAVAERIHTLLNSPWRSRLKPNEIDEMLDGLPGAETLSDEQKLAVRRAVSEPVMVLTGGPGTGKCVVGDTLVLGADGLLPIRGHWATAYGTAVPTTLELPIGTATITNFRALPQPEPDMFMPYTVDVVGRTGAAQTSHAYYGGLRDTIRLRTALGFEVEGTPNHRLWAKTDDGRKDWKRLDAFAVGASVAVRCGSNFWSGSAGTDTLAARIRDERTVHKYDYRATAKKLGAQAAHIYYDREPMFLSILATGHYENTVAYLSCFFENVAPVANENLNLRGRSPLFLRYLQLTLLNFGIVSRYERQGDEAVLSLDTDEWNRLLATFTGEPNGARTEGTDIWDTVVSIEAGRAEVFDLSVPGEESFVANGFVNHNTTTTKIIVAAFEKLEKRLQIASPTGRAAKRASEVTGREAKTIHRMLAFDPEKNDFKHGPGEPLELDVLVIDESSMLDLNLTHKTLRAVPDGAQIIFVGDVDQLPSVGCGNVLHDLINSGRVPVARLTQVFRQAAASKIITNAHAINRGKIPDLLPPTEAKNGADCVFIEVADPEEAIEKIKGVVAKSLPRMGFKPDDITVLTPMQRGSLGGRNLNDVLQSVLNPPSPMKAEHMRGPVTFRVGDRVMQRRNNYDKNVFNGDVGTILGIDPEEQTLAVMYPEQTVEYEYSDTDELMLAYSITTHKSQGSEYPAAIILMANQHYMMLQRNLLYTALTRAKKMAVIIGTKYAIKTAISNKLVQTRYTRLAERLQNLVESLSASARRHASLLDVTAGGGLGGRDLSHPPLPGRLL